MVTIVKQTWWHIEEIYFPSYARKIRHIMDIFTDQTEIPLELDDDFVGLKVIARNSLNREIAFLESNNEGKTSPIILNLDPLNWFPDAPKSLSKEHNLKHAKLEIEYILTNPKIKNLKNNLIDKIKDKITPKKEATIEIGGLIQPEIYVTLPPGWRISGKPEGHAVGVRYFNQNTEETERDEGIKIVNRENPQPHAIKLEEPFIKQTDGKRTYNYLIHHDSYSEIIEIAKNNRHIRFEVTYVSQMSRMVAGVSIVPFVVFLSLSALILFSGVWSITQKSPFIFDSNFGTGYLIILLSFSYFYNNLVKEGFYIPHKNWYIYIFIFSIIMIFSIFLKNVPLFRILIGYF